VTRAAIDPAGDELAALERVGVDFAGLRVLDVGCGDGRMVWRIADRTRSIVGVDPDEERIGLAIGDTPPHLAHKVRFRAASVVDLDDPPSSFDLVFFTWSL
jgi:2-polyprenyl-3-methyl-5-hydroxy-6-metoxy-1,4-benzoquinol methylase